MEKKLSTKATGGNKIAPDAPKTRKPRTPKTTDIVAKESAAIQSDSHRPLTTTPEALLSQAIAQGMSVESLEKLMGMRREIREEHAKEAFFEALAFFQGICPTIKKTKSVTEKDSSATRYHYAPIDQIIEQTKDARQQSQLSHTMATEQSAESVTAICTVHHKDGWAESTRFTVPIDAKAYMSAPQKVASALTFAKRYALCNAYGIVTGDDDNDANDGFQNEPSQEQPQSADADTLYDGIKAELDKLPLEKRGPMLSTAVRLYEGRNISALTAFLESVKRQVVAK